MTQLVTTELARPGTQFAPDVFDSQVGREIPFKINDQVLGTCTLLGASVSEDGSFATMTFEIPDAVAEGPVGVCVHFAGEER